MTTVAMDKTGIACDLQLTHSNGYKFKTKTKVYEFYCPAVYPKPFFIGYCGNAESIISVLDWFSSPVGPAPKAKGAEFVVLTHDKKMFTFMNPRTWIEVSAQHYAIGSGAQYAAGAMASGKTPLEAVKIASQLDTNTGMGFKFYEV